MFFITGISRSGKTSTLAELVKHEPYWTHVVASRVLQDIGRPLRGLDEKSAWKNQLALVNELRYRGLLHSPRTILDGHAVIEVSGMPFPVQDQAFDALALHGIATIHDTKEHLIDRRRASKMKTLTGEKLELLQAQEIEHSRFQAIRLGVPFSLIKSGDTQSLSNWLQDITRDTGAAKIR